MDMIGSDFATDDFDLLFRADLSDQIPSSYRNVPDKDGIPVLRDPDEVRGVVKCTLACLAVILSHASSVSC